MRAKFVGDPSDGFSGPNVYSFRGVNFPKGKWVPLTDAETFRKCEGSSHFETSKAKAATVEYASNGPQTEADAETCPEAEIDDALTGEPGDDAFNGADPAAFDHDNDGAPGGSEPAGDEKADLIAQLEAIPEAEFDKRWGVPRLQAALEAARFLAGDED